MKKEIKYIGFYDFPDSKGKRVSSLAATNKMDYIGDTIIRAGYKVHYISPSWFDDSSSNANFKFQSTIALNEQKKITFCPSFGTKVKWLRNIKIILSLLWLFFWLIFHTKRNEKVILYHVPWLSTPVRWAKSIRAFNLVLEVEEVYGDVSAIHPYFYKLEQKLFIVADSFLFSTEMLAQKINSNKPNVIIYGAYESYPQLTRPPADGKTHLLYAGIIDLHKAGAFSAVEAARHLPNNYIMHIIGFGEIEQLKVKIEDVNTLNGCQVIYDGVLSGNNYIKYCQQCHIGLSTQKMEGEYLASSFPSKILSYLSLGLNVVTCYIDCVAKSKINELMNYYEYDTPESIAKSIQLVNIHDDVNSCTLIKKLDFDFSNQIHSLLIK